MFREKYKDPSNPRDIPSRDARLASEAVNMANCHITSDLNHPGPRFVVDYSGDKIIDLNTGANVPVEAVLATLPRHLREVVLWRM